MKLRKTLLLLLFLAMTSPSISFSDDGFDIQKKVDEINQKSLTSLGISLNALLYLLDSSPTSYYLLSELKRTGKLEYIKELEAKGYVKTETVSELPDGRKLGEHLRIIPTGLGIDVQMAM
jgi:hypothetical protein